MHCNKRIFYLGGYIMATFTDSTYGNADIGTDKAASIIGALIAKLLAVGLREKLDAETSGDKSDASYIWGM